MSEYGKTRDAVRAGYAAGLPTKQIAFNIGSTPGTVRALASAMKITKPRATGASKNREDRGIWEMDENQRRRAFAAKAAKGARDTLKLTRD